MIFFLVDDAGPRQLANIFRLELEPVRPFRKSERGIGRKGKFDRVNIGL
jgi:hypothetical protein